MNNNKKAEFSNGIKALAVLLGALTLVVGIMLTGETKKISESNEELLVLDEKYDTYVTIGQLLASGSNILMDSARHYAVLGDTKYLDQYFFEANDARSRDKAIDMLNEMGNDYDTHKDLVKAMNKSMELMNDEYRSMLLVSLANGLSREDLPEELMYFELSEYEEELSREDKIEEARNIVFSAAYDRDRQDIIDKVNTFTNNSTTAVKSQSEMIYNSLKQSLRFQQLLSGIFVLLLFTSIVLMLSQNRLVTKRKRELDMLSDKLLKQRDELIKANEEAKVAEEAKQEFIARMSYDIRTPINSILGLSEIAKRHVKDYDKVISSLDKIDVASQDLLLLVNDVLDIGRIERGTLQLKLNPVNMVSFIENCCEIAGRQLGSAEIVLIREIRNPEHPNVVADELHLRHALLNIIENAIKFTPKDGRVTIRMHEIECADGKVTYFFEIEDTGVGMSEQFLSHLFEPFSQENVKKDTQGGVGVGLSISKHYITLMGGEINVESTPKVGTKVTIIVPFDEYKAVSEESDTGKKRLGGMNILLVEDNDFNLEIAQELLSDEGANVVLAENGAIAVSLFASSDENYYDAILMDVTMPVVDGLSATRQIRESRRADATTVPVIAMTAHAEDEDVEISRAAGMNGHISKPIDIDMVVNIIIECMKDNNNVLSEQLERALKDANTDALTRVKNRNAFELMTANIDREILNGEKPEFAIVLCDVNGLKYANDNIGHEEGDRLLINSCKVICRLFAHSPVFRIGGDEFTAVLRSDDYANRDSIMNEIFTRMTKDSYVQGQPDEVSFAAGIAVFDPDFDRDCEDVLRRADAEMYKHKKAIKGDDIR